MDEQTNKSETDQSDIRRPNVLLQDHQWQSTSPMIKQITLMTTDEHVPLRPTFQKLEISLTYKSNKSLTHHGQSLSGTQLMDKLKAFKSETDQSVIRQTYVLLQNHQYLSDDQIMITDEHVPLRPAFQKLEMPLTHISNKSLTHHGQSLSGTQS